MLRVLLSELKNLLINNVALCLLFMNELYINLVLFLFMNELL